MQAGNFQKVNDLRSTFIRYSRVHTPGKTRENLSLIFVIVTEEVEMACGG